MLFTCILMSLSQPIPCRELFLLLENLSSKQNEILRKLDLLKHAAERLPILGVDGYYDDEKDVGLLCMRLRTSGISGDNHARLMYLATQNGMPAYEPSGLSLDDQRFFYDTYLSGYSVTTRDHYSINDATHHLIDLLGKVPSARAETVRTRSPTNPPLHTSAFSSRMDTIFDDAPAQAEVSKTLQVRFERGDQWMPARLRNLSVADARLAASAAPPLGSTLRLTLALNNYGISLRGTVVEVINTECSTDGSTSFRVQFAPLSPRRRGRLIGFLKIAKTLSLALHPPPARKNRRFSIHQSLTVATKKGSILGDALDISSQGFFLGTNRKIRNPYVRFSLQIDTDDSISGEAFVVRAVSEEMANQCGLSQGYGLHIARIASKHAGPFSEYIHRVASRSQRHVAVAGNGERSRRLAKFLQSAGYAVSQSESPDYLKQSGAPLSTASAPDIAVVDVSAMRCEQVDLFESVYRSQHVNLLKLQGHALQEARESLDRALAV